MDVAPEEIKVDGIIQDVEMSDENLRDEFYENINTPGKIVRSSFENYMKNLNSSNQSNNLNNFSISTNISRNILSEWNFLHDLERRLGIKLDSQEVLNKIPNLCAKGELKAGRLIKFNCMIQNILENQLYLALSRDKNDKQKFIINKYYEYENSPMMVDNQEDLFGDDFSEMNDNILLDRLALNCVAIPGLSPVLSKQLEIEENLKNKKVIVYDYENSQYKVNQEILVIGVAYEIENTIVIHSWKIIQNYFIFEFERNFSLNNLNKFDFVSSRNLLQDYLKLITNNDDLLSEYLNIFLVSQIFYRLDTKLIGKFLINIINQKETTGNLDYFPALQNLFALITNFSRNLNITTDSLNQRYLYSRFDVNTEELIQGEFQTVDHTFLLLDERNLKEGKLNENGCKNYSAIKNLIDFQTMTYYYPYNQIEIPHETQIVTVTDICKSMFNSSELIEIPFLNAVTGYNSIEHKKNIDLYFSTISEKDIGILRNYFNICRNNEEFLKKFRIDDDVCKSIQKDFTDSKKQNFSADDLDLCMKIARLYAISKGRSVLSFDDYIFAKEAELNRKNRLLNLKKK